MPLWPFHAHSSASVKCTAVGTGALTLLLLLHLARVSSRHAVIHHTSHAVSNGASDPQPEELRGPHSDDAWSEDVLLAVAPAAGQPKAPAKKKAAAKCGAAGTGPATEPHPNSCPWWQAMHEEFVAQVRAADAGKGFEVILYGDSLTEMWHGTRGNRTYAPRAQLPGIFQKHLGKRWRTAAFGMSGDTAANLEWRLLHSELSQKRQPKAVVVLIGTNDLKDAKQARDASQSLRESTTREQAIARAAPALSRRIISVVDLLRERLPNSNILLMALLPRHKANQKPPLAWPNLYSKGLERVNRDLAKAAQKRQGAVTFLDCGQPFFASPELLNAELLPDALHPSPEGAKLLIRCMRSALDGIMTSSGSAAGAAR